MSGTVVAIQTLADDGYFSRGTQFDDSQVYASVITVASDGLGTTSTLVTFPKTGGE